jgi:hypothetical protein
MTPAESAAEAGAGDGPAPAGGGPLRIVYRRMDDLIPYVGNARTHSPEQVMQLVGSLRRFGWTNPILLDGDDGILAGHGRLMAARHCRDHGVAIPRHPDPAVVPTIDLHGLSRAEQRAYVIADNQLAANAGWNDDALAAEVASLRADDFPLDLLGFDDARLTDLLALLPAPGDPAALPPPGDGDGDPGHRKGSLAERFGVPPFTVLSAREGWWQERKRAWIALGIQSELGRGEDRGLAIGISPYGRATRGDGKGYTDEGRAAAADGAPVRGKGAGVHRKVRRGGRGAA